MSELRKSFVAGKMNKDLDERLVPQGEYRDAMNIEVSTSEGSDVGAVQAVMGNTPVSVNFYATTPGLGLQISPNAVCIGEIVDEKSDKLYWLVCDDNPGVGWPKKDIIVEYDNTTGTILPVVVDIWDDGTGNTWPRALKFNSQFPVTGINIISDMLFWTDNNSEPKKINIPRSKSGCIHPHPYVFSGGTPSFSKHTNFTTNHPTIPNTLWLGSAVTVTRRLKEEHITVIKEAPLLTPSLQMKNVASRTDDSGTLLDYTWDPSITTGPNPGNWGINPFFDPVTLNPLEECWIFFGGINVTNNPSGAVYTYPMNPTYNINDIIAITNSSPINAQEPEQIKVRILEGPNEEYGGYRVEVIFVHPNIISTVLGPFTTTLEEASPYYKEKFARFATRYKYDDGEYSAFSSFSEPAFLPGKFDYKPKEAYNLGMESDLKYLAIYDFIGNDNLIPAGVVSVDILYKESDSPNIYLIKTIKRNDKEWVDRWDPISDAIGGSAMNPSVKGYLKIESEVIHAALPANQFIRPWDNVPRKALGQEVSGNRLIFGNYLQNYNLTYLNISTGEYEVIEPDLEIKIESRLVGTTLAEQHYAEKALNYYPAKSLKTLRTYQLGVIYTDRYGRQTPVFSSGEHGLSSTYLEKDYSHQANQLKVKTNHKAPSWAETFKFFIKETSNEYYNLSLDRWYNAEDGNVWLSFPSAERNKVDEDTYLILKKEHNNSIPVNSPAKYKVIAIENEAPDYIKQVYQGLGKHTDLSQCTAFPCTTYQGFIDAAGNASMFGDPSGVGWPRSGMSYFILDRNTAWDLTGWNSSVFGTGKTELYLRFGNGQLASKWYKMSSAALSGTSHVRIDIKENFSEDVDAITNTSNGAPVTTSTAIVSPNVYLEIREKVVDETRPEFDGRFFVKILKDAVFSRTIGKINAGSANSYGIIFEKVVRYIDSYNAWSNYGGDFYDFIGNNDAGYWDGFNVSNRDLVNSYDQDTWQNNGGTGNPFNRYFFNAAREQTGDFMNRLGNGGENQWGMSTTARLSWGDNSTVKDWDLHPNWNNPWAIWGAPSYPTFQAPQYATSENILGKMNTATYTFGGTNTPVWTTTRGGGEKFWKAFCKWSGAANNKGKAHWFIDKRPRFYEMSQIRHPSNILGEAGMMLNSYNQPIWLAGTSPFYPLGNTLSSLGPVMEAWVGYRDGSVYGMLDATENNTGAMGGFVHTMAMMPYRFNQFSNQPWYDQPANYDQNDYEVPTFHGAQTGAGGVAAYNRDPVFLGNPSLSGGSEDGPEPLQSYSRGIYDSEGLGIIDTIDLSAVIPHGDNGTWPKGQYAMDNPFNIWAWMSAWEGANGEYVNDIAFINSLTTKNTYWKWAEDPHLDSNLDRVGLIYKTTDFIESCGSMANFVQRIAFHSSHTAPFFNPGIPSYLTGMGKGAPRLVDEVFYLGASAYHSYNKAARWRFRARLASDSSVGLGQTPQAFGPNMGNGGCYLPTNDPRWIEGDFSNATDPWDNTGIAATPPMSHKSTAPLFNPKGAAPGIRSDGMYNGASLNVSPAVSGDQVGRPRPTGFPQDNWPGQVTWLILEPQYDEELEQPQSENPAIFETEPKETVGLDIYHEVSQVYPIDLNWRTSQLYIPKGSVVSCYRPIDSTFVLINSFGSGNISLGDTTLYTLPITIKAVNDNVITLMDSTPSGLQMPGAPPPPIGAHDFLQSFSSEYPQVGDILTFTRPDGSTTSAEISGTTVGSSNYTLKRAVHNMEMTLPWFNCWAFGNGVESNRIRDDYNTIYLDKGPRVSATLEDIGLSGSSYKYEEERRGSGLIYSGIYNSMSGVNNLNQFVAAEKITKDVNPTYGTIQKLFSRNTDLVTFCEDRVLKVLANKDAMFNADGNINVTSNLNVLGQAMPYSGDYGISKDPTSFASESFRVYFTDRNRGVVLRLSKDGLTPISEYGMKDWFNDNLPNTGRITGSIDEKKTHYNVTLKDLEKTVSFSERSKGWESFKSFAPERGVSFNNEYYTIKGGHLWKHHSNPLHRNFYGSISDGFGQLSISSIKFLFNSAPEVVKSFGTLDYEGSQARITQDIATYVPPIFGDGEYYDNYDTSGGYIPGFLGKLGWYVDSMVTNLQQVPNLEFKNKEGKWFSTIRGDITTLNNLDTSEFSVQGIGNASQMTNTPISGCADVNAAWAIADGYPNAVVQNYDPAADHDCVGDPIAMGFDDHTCCVYCDPGCTDPSAYNHDPFAQCYTIGPAPNYTNVTVNTAYSADDGSCLYCQDPTYWGLVITNATTNLSTCASNTDGSIDFIAQSNNACTGVNITIMDSGYNSIGNFPHNVPNGTLLSSYLTNTLNPPEPLLLPSGIYNIQICDDSSCSLGCGCLYFQVTIFQTL